METTHKEYSENDSDDTLKTAAEYGNKPAGMQADNTGNNTFGDSDTTTGSGYSEAERKVQDGHVSDNDEVVHRGSRELIDKYNINDQAHSDSSKDDFIPTVSNFHHADEPDEPTDQSRH